MDINKDYVLSWLDKENRSRDWLADKCGVARGTVNNWLVSPRPIPSKAMVIIKGLIDTDTAKAEASKQAEQNLVLKFSDQVYSAMEERALEENTTLRKWAKKKLTDAAYEDMDAFAENLIISRVAEDPAPYNEGK